MPLKWCKPLRRGLRGSALGFQPWATPRVNPALSAEPYSPLALGATNLPAPPASMTDAKDTSYRVKRETFTQKISLIS